MARLDASDLAARLGRQAEAVCRRYLDAGRRQGNYWQVGDVRNTPGRSMFVRLKDSPKGPAGKWTDAATAEHGDLLDVIRETLGLIDFADVVEEARAFLSLPHPESEKRRQNMPPAPSGSAEAARRLFAIGQPIAGTVAKTYLRKRGITALHGTDALRFHPQCYYQPETGPTETWPALLARVTDLQGRQTGAHRTWLAPDGSGKAPIDTQRKAMGELHGHGVRFGIGTEVQAAGEGIETILSLRSALPDLAAVAALSAAHLCALLLPDSLRRLYVARDNDPAGEAMAAMLGTRAEAAGIEAAVLVPTLGDFNDDLQAFGVEGLRAGLRAQLLPQDVARFMTLAAWAGRGERHDRARGRPGGGGSDLPATGENRDQDLPQRAIGHRTARPGNGCGRRFSAGSCAALHREAISPDFAILRCAAALPLRSRVQGRTARRLSSPWKAARVAVTGEGTAPWPAITTTTSPSIRPRPPTTSSRSFSSTATVPSRTSPIPARCRRVRSSPA